MFRAYLAVIHDSFRAAFASRVLYIVLALIVVVLLALAPLHLRQETDWQLSWQRHFVNRTRLANRLVEEGKSGDRPAVAHLWNKLSPELQKQLESFANDSDEKSAAEPPGDDHDGPSRRERVFRNLADELNALMEKADFYDAGAFGDRRMNEETTELIERGPDSLSDLEIKRLNRLLIASALRRDIEMPSANQLDLYYGTWGWPGVFAGLSRAELSKALSETMLFNFDKFVMSIGIFIAILVTASIIPEMLEAGSLNLLLSKPVTRWGLLLAKFVGGCTFILLCATLFFAGVWLWMGIQMGVWESALLYSIPVYLMVFSMYYSVSVLAGIWFRSPILCITLAILFWGVCFAIGFGYNRLDNRYYNQAPVELVAAGNSVMFVDLFQNNQLWNTSTQDWESIASAQRSKDDETGMAVVSYMIRLDQAGDLAAAPRPVSNATNDGFVAVATPGGTGPLAGGPRSVVSFQPDPDRTSMAQGALPNGTSTLLQCSENTLLVIDQSGSVLQKKLADAATTIGGDDPVPIGDDKPGLVGRILQANPVTPGFETVSALEEPLNLVGSRAAATNEKGDIACYSRGHVFVLTRGGDENVYRVSRQAEIGQQENIRMTAWIEFRGNTIFLILGNGHFFHINADNLETVWTDIVDNRVAVRDMSVSPDGNFSAVTFRNGRMWLYDAQLKGESNVLGLGGHRDILATTFDEHGRLLTGDRFLAVRAWDLKSSRELESHVPSSDWVTTGFRYVVRPLYRIFPKPGEFYKVLGRLTSTGDARHNPQIDLTREPQPDNPWLPLWSGLLFMTVTLGIACWAFQRADY